MPEAESTPLGDWMPVVAETELPEGRAIRVSAGGVDVFLYKAGSRIFAMDNRCNHMGGPLHRGVVKGDVAQPTVTCPVHGSMFWLTDGRVMRGPAMRPQRVFDARVNDGTVEIRRQAEPGQSDTSNSD